MIEALPNVAALLPAAATRPVDTGLLQAGPASPSFQQLLSAGVAATDAKIAEADRLVAAFAVDNDIPVHQVTFALEEARLSLEMMIQVRNRLIEGYQQIMNMQV
jgi:flagellar hook-basal body complex protein FliE